MKPAPPEREAVGTVEGGPARIPEDRRSGAGPVAAPEDRAVAGRFPGSREVEESQLRRRDDLRVIGKGSRERNRSGLGPVRSPEAVDDVSVAVALAARGHEDAQAAPH